MNDERNKLFDAIHLLTDAERQLAHPQFSFSDAIAIEEIIKARELLQELVRNADKK